MKKNVILSLSLLLALPLAAAVDLNVPDKEGMTLKGVVYCGNTPLKDVQVTDGINITRTDDNGWYYLASDKSQGHVYICNPKGYLPTRDGKVPEFFKTVNSKDPDAVEQKNFILTEDTHPASTILFLADVQMSGRCNDKNQFIKNMVPDVNATIQSKREEGKGVYIVTLGDQTYDKYWYTNGFGIQQSKSCFANFKADLIYHCMGNHDHDPNVLSDDWGASHMFRKYWGPTYYSMNLGDAHVVVLDNIVYKNPAGERNYDCDIPNQMMKWLRKDLENVSKETPVFICMHAPLYNRPQCSTPNVESTASFHYNFGTNLYNSFKGFKDVQVFTGHAHTNYVVTQGNVTEYNVGAACGNLWWPSYFVDGNFVCSDGSPGGYRVLDMEDNNIKSYYKSIGYGKGLQFRSYDLNNTYLTADKFAPSLADKSLFVDWLASGKFGYDSTDYKADGTPKQPNRVLINVFAYDPRWTVEVQEEGIPLTVQRISTYDPYAMISDGAQRFENTGHNSAGNPTRNSHLFMVQASSPTSTLHIRVTDPFGNVYTEDMVRPKNFSIEQYMNETGSSDVKSIAAAIEDAPTEYYDLFGRRLTNPDRGLVIVKKGSKANKVLY